MRQIGGYPRQNYRNCVLHNRLHTANFTSAKYIIFGWLWSNCSYFIHGCVHGCIQNLESTLKPFASLLWTPPPPCQKPWVRQWNNTLEILPLKLQLGIRKWRWGCEGPRNQFLAYISIIYHFFKTKSLNKKCSAPDSPYPSFFLIEYY